MRYKRKRDQETSQARGGMAPGCTPQGPSSDPPKSRPEKLRGHVMRRRFPRKKNNGAVHHTIPVTDALWAYRCDCGKTWQEKRLKGMSGAGVQRGMTCPDFFTHGPMAVLGREIRALEPHEL